ncbi:C factor, cell signaling protein [Stappia sp. 22II-S9-Z10]|nr:C factor, cell signaling protein [Stappia sp. 22II-S9-Z10]
MSGWPARALVVGASGGIGAALAAALEARGAVVTRLSRSADGLDVTDEASVAAHIGALGGVFDCIIIATGALVIDGAAPEKSIRALTPDAMQRQFDLNTVGPAMVLKHAWPLIAREGRTVVAVLSARVGSIGDNRLGGWTSYRTAKAAVNQVVRTAAVELARSRRDAILVALHPGTVATRFTADYQDRYDTVPPDAAAANLLAVIDALTPRDTGGFFDWKGDPIPW